MLILMVFCDLFEELQVFTVEHGGGGSTCLDLPGLYIMKRFYAL